ncbi:hypothetical protein [Listeria booriae]|uniref:hypothetical protein n=1 Tax=Listeria booriae TaxID=1552123 RepID=UPI0016234312|nr:hypothetical protein [Listeria booriae]MBC2190531.1 hypothetical protein [Listeria booriae]MBC6163300.1 hypothetical protein [Listeria booriae]
MESYLTLSEYNALGFERIEDQEHFDKLLSKASAVLDNATRRFYVFEELESDYPYRKDAFKKALGCQIEYFLETGELTTESLNNSPQNVAIGGTSISNTSKFNAAGKNESKSIISDDIYIYLEGTGLLSRGVC